MGKNLASTTLSTEFCEGCTREAMSIYDTIRYYISSKDHTSKKTCGMIGTQLSAEEKKSVEDVSNEKLIDLLCKCQFEQE